MSPILHGGAAAAGIAGVAGVSATSWLWKKVKERDRRAETMKKQHEWDKKELDRGHRMTHRLLITKYEDDLRDMRKERNAARSEMQRLNSKIESDGVKAERQNETYKLELYKRIQSQKEIRVMKEDMLCYRNAIETVVKVIKDPDHARIYDVNLENSDLWRQISENMDFPTAEYTRRRELHFMWYTEHFVKFRDGFCDAIRLLHRKLEDHGIANVEKAELMNLQDLFSRNAYHAEDLPDLLEATQKLVERHFDLLMGLLKPHQQHSVAPLQADSRAQMDALKVDQTNERPARVRSLQKLGVIIAACFHNLWAEIVRQTQQRRTLEWRVTELDFDVEHISDQLEGQIGISTFDTTQRTGGGKNQPDQLETVRQQLKLCIEEREDLRKELLLEKCRRQAAEGECLSNKESTITFFGKTDISKQKLSDRHTTVDDPDRNYEELHPETELKQSSCSRAEEALKQGLKHTTDLSEQNTTLKKALRDKREAHQYTKEDLLQEESNGDRKVPKVVDLDDSLESLQGDLEAATQRADKLEHHLRSQNNGHNKATDLRSQHDGLIKERNAAKEAPLIASGGSAATQKHLGVQIGSVVSSCNHSFQVMHEKQFLTADSKGNSSVSAATEPQLGENITSLSHEVKIINAPGSEEKRALSEETKNPLDMVGKLDNEATTITKEHNGNFPSYQKDKTPGGSEWEYHSRGPTHLPMGGLEGPWRHDRAKDEWQITCKHCSQWIWAKKLKYHGERCKRQKAKAKEQCPPDSANPDSL